MATITLLTLKSCLQVGNLKKKLTLFYFLTAKNGLAITQLNEHVTRINFIKNAFAKSHFCIISNSIAKKLFYTLLFNCANSPTNM
jgi:hypothetical protein